jgi:hypothetical protein
MRRKTPTDDHVSVKGRPENLASSVRALRQIKSAGMTDGKLAPEFFGSEAA